MVRDLKPSKFAVVKFKSNSLSLLHSKPIEHFLNALSGKSLDWLNDQVDVCKFNGPNFEAAISILIEKKLANGEKLTERAKPSMFIDESETDDHVPLKPGHKWVIKMTKCGGKGQMIRVKEQVPIDED